MLLDEIVLVAGHAAHLLADGADGETPAPPPALARAASSGDVAAIALVELPRAVLGVLEVELGRLRADPSDEWLSPAVAEALLSLSAARGALGSYTYP